MPQIILDIGDRVKETSVTTGTGAYTLAGAVFGFQTFVQANLYTNKVIYVAEDVITGAWEIGVGTVTNAVPSVLTRTSIISSSNANAAVSWVAGTRQIFCSNSATQSGAGDMRALRNQFMAFSLTTTNATPTIMTGVDYTPNIAGRTNGAFNAIIYGNNGTTDSASWEIKGSMRNSVLVGANIKTATGVSAGAAAWDASVGVNSGTSAIEITLTGAAATTITWTATMRWNS